jgi:uncharacterized protein YbjT (DUF2867 family)
MKIVVIGGTGRIGSRVVTRLKQQGHEAVPAAPETGVNTLTGEGLAQVLAGAKVVVDVANSPSFDDEPAMTFFRTAGQILLAAEQSARVGHHVALSVVGTERLQASGYFRAKLVQEELIKASGLPYTILRSTQFFPFVSGIVESGAVGGQIRLPSAYVQPVSADDVADALAEIAVSPPANNMLEVAGPDLYRLDSLAEAYLSAKGDPRQVVADPSALYFGAVLEDRTLTPGEHPRIGKARFEDWLGAEIPAD